MSSSDPNIDPLTESQMIVEFLKQDLQSSQARVRELETMLVELVTTIEAAYPCKEHDMEPNLTLDYFRCDKCGGKARVLGSALKAKAMIGDGE